MQFLFNLLIIALIGAISLLATQVDRLSYEVAKEKVSRAYQIMEISNADNRPQAEMQSKRLLAEAHGLCVGSFLTTLLSFAKKGPCSEIIDKLGEKNY